MPNLGPTELIIILVIVIIIFGAGKIADLGGALGRGVRDFRSAVTDANEEPDEEGENKVQKAKAAAAPGKAVEGESKPSTEDERREEA